MSKNLYVDFHVLQTLPPSCVNRDDTGSPKTAVFGGKTRARVSSQAWKRAMRLMFNDIFTEEQIGYRTRNIKKLLVKRLLEQDTSLDAETANNLADTVMKQAQIKSDENKKDVLFFISEMQIRALAKTALDLRDNKSMKEKDFGKAYNAALMEKPSIDLVLFGRMAANDPSLNYDACAQVAHAISTHAVSNEYDYFTAVDDFSDDKNSGAGHLGTVEYNSSTLYRYATVNVREMSKHLNKEEVCTAIRGFAEAFIKSMPTGKQNTFANRTLPDMVYVTIRTDQPVNMANAFERAIPAGENGYLAGSKAALARYAENLYDTWTDKPLYSWCIGATDNQLGDDVNYHEMLDLLENNVKDLI